MDSVTQFALGAGIGLVVLGPRMGARKAILTGGILGSLPDADVLLSYPDPIDSFVSHRGFSHSLFVHAALTPVLGEGLHRIAASLRQDRGRAWLAVFLCLTTHALLDAFTVYGTRLFWPLWPDAIGLGSMFIIDPAYTLPLLAAVLCGLAIGGKSPGLRHMMLGALAVSSAYLGWSVIGQQVAEARASRYLAAAGITPNPIMATAAPFNTLFWRVIAIDGGRYFNIYIPLLGGEEAISAYTHPRHTEVITCLGANNTIAVLDTFTDGFNRFIKHDDTIVMADLRMGLTPLYAFRFVLAEHGTSGLRPVPPRRIDDSRESEGDWEWLKAGILGNNIIRPAEAESVFIEPHNQIASATGSNPIAC